jgi:DNA-binding NtrC family response regulator
LEFALLVGVVGVLAVRADVFACGDKLVVVGRGLKTSRAMGAPHRASILVYADPKGSLPAALEEGHLRKDLERAGHRLRTTTSREEFDAALGTGTYDLVLADFKAAPLLESETKAAASKPTILPTLYNPSDAELAAASRQYSCVVKAPGDQKDYMTVINEAMADRAKQAAPKTK